jgi:hypothetical protein
MASQYVGIDLHRRRSVIVRQTADGQVVDTVRIDNDPVALSCAIAEAGPDPRSSSRLPTGGAGRSMCSRRAEPRCISRIRSA